MGAYAFALPLLFTPLPPSHGGGSGGAAAAPTVRHMPLLAT
nr:MAG TPA: hypothetical protein [Caudoviricetes sp.]